ncbi:MAG: hypothetical protein ILP14_08035 [Oscillospiraceae bacterium]|nr:hypothetical protein [Oscillospiraceae bacterium]
MKRVVAMALAIILVQTWNLAVWGAGPQEDERTTEVTYVVNSDAYEISIPSSISLNADRRLPITLTESHTTLQISVVGSNPDGSSAFNMKGENTGKKIRYSITDEAGNYYGPSSPIILNGVGIPLYITPDESDLKFAAKDIYKDTLVFSIG